MKLEIIIIQKFSEIWFREISWQPYLSPARVYLVHVPFILNTALYPDTESSVLVTTEYTSTKFDS